MRNSASATRRTDQAEWAKRISAAVALLCEGLPGKTPSAVTFKAYEVGLADLPAEAVEAAAMRALRSCKFVPSVAELREMCGALTLEQRSIRAWDALERAVREVGYYRSIVFDDPALQATVRNLGGWMQVCDVSASENPDDWSKWFRKDFERVYRSFAAGQVPAESLEPLVGFADQQNGFLGRREGVKPPIEFKTGLPPLLGQSPVKQRPKLTQERAETRLTDSIGKKP